MSGAANIISTGINFAWFFRGKDKNVMNYSEMGTSISGLAVLSIMDMINCTESSMLTGNTEAIAYAASVALLAIGVVFEILNGNWADITEVGV